MVFLDFFFSKGERPLNKSMYHVTSSS